MSESTAIAMIKGAIRMLENKFDDLILHAQEDMTTNCVNIRHLRHSIIRLPYKLKNEHGKVVRECHDDLRKAESVDDVFLIFDDYWDFLNYSLLQHIIDRHASNMVKNEMGEYAKEIHQFKKTTSLHHFSKVYKRKPKKVDNEFRRLVSEYNIDWSAATLEDVDQFRSAICSEPSLFAFALQLACIVFG